MSKTFTRSAIHRAVEQLIMENYELYIERGIATLMNGAVGVDMESRLLFSEKPYHMKILPPFTPKVEVIAKIKDLIKLDEVVFRRFESGRWGSIRPFVRWRLEQHPPSRKAYRIRA